MKLQATLCFLLQLLFEVTLSEECRTEQKMYLSLKCTSFVTQFFSLAFFMHTAHRDSRLLFGAAMSYSCDSCVYGGTQNLDIQW